MIFMKFQKVKHEISRISFLHSDVKIFSSSKKAQESFSNFQKILTKKLDISNISKITVYRSLFYTIKAMLWPSFDQASRISPSPRQRQSKNQLVAGNPAELILFALLEFRNKLLYFLWALLGFGEKRQIINPEVRSNSLQVFLLG